MTMTLGMDLHVDVWGAGEAVLFVHASFGDGTQDWVAQRPLAGRYRMLLLDRRGYGNSPPRTTPATFDVRAFDTHAEGIGAARPIPPGVRQAGPVLPCAMCSSSAWPLSARSFRAPAMPSSSRASRSTSGSPRSWLPAAARDLVPHLREPWWQGRAPATR